MGLVLLYMLAYSHSNSRFDYFEEEPQQQQLPDWAKARLDSPGWVEQHDRFIAEINDAREEQVRCTALTPPWLPGGGGVHALRYTSTEWSKWMAWPFMGFARNAEPGVCAGVEPILREAGPVLHPRCI